MNNLIIWSVWNVQWGAIKQIGKYIEGVIL